MSDQIKHIGDAVIAKLEKPPDWDMRLAEMAKDRSVHLNAWEAGEPSPISCSRFTSVVRGTALNHCKDWWATACIEDKRKIFAYVLQTLTQETTVPPLTPIEKNLKDPKMRDHLAELFRFYNPSQIGQIAAHWTENIRAPHISKPLENALLGDLVVDDEPSWDKVKCKLLVDVLRAYAKELGASLVITVIDNALALGPLNDQASVKKLLDIARPQYKASPTTCEAHITRLEEHGLYADTWVKECGHIVADYAAANDLERWCKMSGAARQQTFVYVIRDIIRQLKEEEQYNAIEQAAHLDKVRTYESSVTLVNCNKPLNFKENTMSLANTVKLETVQFLSFNGTRLEVTKLTDDQLVDHISGIRDRINELEKRGIPSKKITDKIGELRKVEVELISILDAR